MNTLAAAQQPPSFLSVAPDNWKLAIVVGLIVSVLAAILLPAAASFWVVGAMMALESRRRTGRGQVVDVALYEAVFNMMESVLPEYDMFGIVRERTGRLSLRKNCKPSAVNSSSVRGASSVSRA